MAARKDANDTIDPSHQPTRKIESMSTLVAEMIVEAYDTDATGERADAAAIEMARLIEVRSVPPPPPGPEAAPAPSPDLDLDELPAFRPRRRTVAIGVGIVASLIAAASVAAFLLAR